MCRRSCTLREAAGLAYTNIEDWKVPLRPLSQAAIDIIDQLPRFEECFWLIPNPETKAPYVTSK